VFDSVSVVFPSALSSPLRPAPKKKGIGRSNMELSRKLFTAVLLVMLLLVATGTAGWLIYTSICEFIWYGLLT
jgi:hypothetical protein